MELQDKLRHLRKESGISQIDAAEKLEVSRQTVSRWEAGTSVPTTENLARLSALYGVPLDAWLREDWEPSDLSAPPEAEPEPAVPEPPAQGRAERGKLLRRPALKAAVLAVVLAAGIAIGIWFSHRNDPEVILQKDMNCEVIDLSTLEDPLPGLPLPVPPLN